MKQLYTFLLLSAILLQGFAQAPQNFSYQAVVRDGSNNLLTNTNLGIQISIHKSSAEGVTVYTETHTAQTNANGLLSLQIGDGTSSDDFSSIDWSSGVFFIRTKIDPDGGGNYTLETVSQLLSVPYALYAATSGNDPVEESPWSANTSDIYFSSGNVGIGNSSPQSLLAVGCSGNVDYAISCKGDNGIIGIGASEESSFARGGYFESTTYNGTGVYGFASGTTGSNIGGAFYAHGPMGKGIYCSASNTDGGINYGGVFDACGTSGRGVYATASATGDYTNYGGYFAAKGKYGKGVYATAIGEEATGVSSYVTGLNGIGVYGRASNSGSATNYGGKFESGGTEGIGVCGIAVGVGDDVSYGGKFLTNSSAGIGVYGEATRTGDFVNIGGYFVSKGQRGKALYCEATGTGQNYGGYFWSTSSTGRGIYSGATGSSAYGIYVYTNGESAHGIRTLNYGASSYGVRAFGGLYDFYAEGSGTHYGTSSSKRWKNNVTTMDSVLFKLENLRGVYFTWDEEHGGKHDFGFIAEEIREYFPECVSTDPDNPEYAHGMDYGKMTPVLLQAIKEQQEIIDTQSAKIENLEGRLATMEALLKQLTLNE